MIIADIQALTECKNLSVLDLSYNRIEDPLILEVLSEIPELKGKTCTVTLKCIYCTELYCKKLYKIMDLQLNIHTILSIIFVDTAGN